MSAERVSLKKIDEFVMKERDRKNDFFRVGKELIFNSLTEFFNDHKEDKVTGLTWSQGHGHVGPMYVEFDGREGVYAVGGIYNLGLEKLAKCVHALEDRFHDENIRPLLIELFGNNRTVYTHLHDGEVKWASG